MLNLITENNLSFTKQKCNCGLSVNKKSSKSLNNINRNKKYKIKNKTRKNKSRNQRNKSRNAFFLCNYSVQLLELNGATPIALIFF